MPVTSYTLFPKTLPPKHPVSPFQFLTTQSPPLLASGRVFKNNLCLWREIHASLHLLAIVSMQHAFPPPLGAVSSTPAPSLGSPALQAAPRGSAPFTVTAGCQKEGSWISYALN